MNRLEAMTILLAAVDTGSLSAASRHAAATWPLATRAQQREPLRRIAILQGAARDTPGTPSRWRCGRSRDVKSHSNYSHCLCDCPRSYGLRLRPESVATGRQRYGLYGF